MFNSSKADDVAEEEQINIYISPRFEEIFGAEMTESLLEEFRELHTDFQIHLLKAEQDGIQPDVLIFDDEDFNVLASMGSLAELNEYTDYDSGTRQLAIPLVSFMDFLFYNIDVLSAAGFDRPPKTREEFLNYARTVSNGGAASGSAISLGAKDKMALSRDIFSWIWASGGNFWLNENKPALNNGMAGDFSFLGSLYDGNVLAPGVFDITGEQRLKEFEQGKIAMMIASSRVIPYLKENMKDGAFDITAIPSSAGRYNSGLSSIYTGINANSEYPDNAWSFLVFLTQKAAVFCELFNAVPGVISDIIPGNYVKDDPIYSKAWYIFESSGVVKNFSGKPGAEEYENIFFQELQSFFKSTRTPQETIAAIQRRWDEIYPKHYQ